MSTLAIFEILMLLIWGGYFMYQFRRRRLTQLINQFPGVPTIPIIGNSFTFLGSTSTILERVQNTVFKYPSPTRLWLFSKPIILVYDPENYQIVSNRALKRGSVLNFFKEICGGGLIILDAIDTWKEHRRSLNPAFNLNVMGKKYLEIYHRVEHKLIQDLDVLADTDQQFDLMQFIYSREYSKIFNVISGYDTEHVEGKHGFADFLVLMRDASQRVIKRIYSPWLHPEMMYKIYTQLVSGGGPSLEKFRELPQKILKDREEQIKNMYGDIRDSEIEKENRILIDILLDPKVSSGYDARGLVDEMVTFLDVGSITISTTVCFTLLMLAMHQEQQNQVYNEIELVFKNREDVTDVQEFDKLTSMERCISETLRLFPASPFNIRNNEEDITLKDGRIIPADTVIVLCMLILHRNRNIYPNPEVWDPHRFLPEELIKRHPCSFVPFGAGPRSCIGYKYAYLSIKSQLVALLRRYHFTTDLQMSDIKLSFDTVLKNTVGNLVYIHRRK